MRSRPERAVMAPENTTLRYEAGSFERWRAVAREYLARQISPDQIEWRGDLLSAASQPLLQPIVAGAGHAVNISRELMALLRQAALYRDEQRWAFLYRVLWRYAQGEHDVVSPADRDGRQLALWVKAVRREIHDMHAYVRFRERDTCEGSPQFVAWFVPAHDVLAEVGDHFARRMGQRSWMIATPDAALVCDGTAWHLAPPVAQGVTEQDDAIEALWLTYYRNIFNPSRLNEKVMHSHIRQRFWQHLPEASVLPDMIGSARAGARKTGQAPVVAEHARNKGVVIPLKAAHEVVARGVARHTPSGELADCRRCTLWQNATQAVAGAGNARAQIMIVGEQPGDQEDISGLPFTGPAGDVLNRALHQAGLNRDELFITNAVKHFKWIPRGKRRLHKTPAQQEIESCRHWLEQELATVQPRIIVTLGATALKAVMHDASAALQDYLGRVVTASYGATQDGLSRPTHQIIAAFHPSYVLRLSDPAQQGNAFGQIVQALEQARSLAGQA